MANILAYLLRPIIITGGWIKTRNEHRRNTHQAWVTALLEAGWEWDGE